MTDPLPQILERLDRIDRAILGDPEVGHRGLVQRVDQIEVEHEGIPSVHSGISEQRIAGDRRLHDRIDSHETDTRDRLDSIERKLDRAIYLTAGAFLGGITIGGTSVWAILGG